MRDGSARLSLALEGKLKSGKEEPNRDELLRGSCGWSQTKRHRTLHDGIKYSGDRYATRGTGVQVRGNSGTEIIPRRYERVARLSRWRWSARSQTFSFTT
jgi:hypothetical protein